MKPGTWAILSIMTAILALLLISLGCASVKPLCPERFEPCWMGGKTWCCLKEAYWTEGKQ